MKRKRGGEERSFVFFPLAKRPSDEAVSLHRHVKKWKIIEKKKLSLKILRRNVAKTDNRAHTAIIYEKMREKLKISSDTSLVVATSQ